jgi:hypothetical protein
MNTNKRVSRMKQINRIKQINKKKQMNQKNQMNKKNQKKQLKQVIRMKEIKVESNITIIIHLFNETLWKEFLEYINNVKQVFKVVKVIISIQENSNFDNIIKKEDNNFVVLKLVNKGVDIYSFLEGIKYIRKNNITTDFILKLHTKESINSVENLLEWRKDLIGPITNINNLFIIKHYFKTVENLGYIASQKCILPKNYDLDFPQNIKGLNNLCEKFSHLEKEWTDFIGGNIFWISNSVINQYLTDPIIEYCINNFTHGKPGCNLTDKKIYVEYLCERLFTGIFCYNKTNILVNDYKGTERGISSIDKYFYLPNVFSFHIPNNIITN